MLVVGQNLNSASPSVHAALAAGDRAWVERCVRAQVAAGVDALDCCAATFGQAEGDVLRWLVEIAETVAELPVALDSPHADVLVGLTERRRHRPLLNSVDASGEWPPPLAAAVRKARASLVVQLRLPDGRVPQNLEDRQAWTGRALVALSRHDISLDRVWIDPVLLPWGEDLRSGEPLLEYLRRAPLTWPGMRTLVGLSNVSYGARQRRRLHLQWMEQLRDAGLAGVILDPLDTQLVAAARGGT